MTFSRLSPDNNNAFYMLIEVLQTLIILCATRMLQHNCGLLFCIIYAQNENRRLLSENMLFSLHHTLFSADHNMEDL